MAPGKWQTAAAARFAETQSRLLQSPDGPPGPEKNYLWQSVDSTSDFALPFILIVQIRL